MIQAVSAAVGMLSIVPQKWPEREVFERRVLVLLCRKPSGASGLGKRPCLAWPGFAALIGFGEFQEDANVPLKIGLRPVKVEVAYGNPGVFAANSRVEGFTDDAVHASERANINYAIQTLSREIHSLAHVQYHFSIGAKRRQIRLCVVQHLLNMLGFFMPIEILVEDFEQRMLIFALDLIPDAGAKRLERNLPPVQPQRAGLIHVWKLVRFKSNPWNVEVVSGA